MVNDNTENRSDGHFVNAMSFMRDRHFTHVVLPFSGNSIRAVCNFSGHLVACKSPANPIRQREHDLVSQGSASLTVPSIRAIVGPWLDYSTRLI